MTWVVKQGMNFSVTVYNAIDIYTVLQIKYSVFHLIMSIVKVIVMGKGGGEGVKP